ncbi:unnamed protein product, partial [Scytosiphon promiscuus]
VLPLLGAVVSSEMTRRIDRYACSDNKQLPSRRHSHNSGGHHEGDQAYELGEITNQESFPP